MDDRRFEHCVGPLGVGSLIVKPVRHVLHVADLDDAEVVEMGTAAPPSEASAWRVLATRRHCSTLGVSPDPADVAAFAYGSCPAEFA